MPAAPLLMVGASVTGVSAAVGSAVASAVVGATVSTAVATAVGSGIIAAGVTAAMGGDASDVLKAAVIGGGSAFLGNVAGGAAGKAAQAAGYSDEVTNIVSAAAAGGAENTAQALGYGADLGEALKEGAVGSLAAGATVGTLDVINPKQTQSGISVPRSGAPSDVPEVGLRTGTPRAAPDMDGGTGIVPPADALLPMSVRRDIASGRAMVTADGDVIPTMRTPEGRIIPAMTDADGNLRPREMETAKYDFSDLSTKFGDDGTQKIKRPFATSELGETGEAILAQFIYPEFASAASSLFNRDRGAPAPGSESQATQLGTETVGTPSSAALAQALRVSPGEPVFGSEDTGRQRRVWNVSSLKLKDEVGG